jgi:hypothetical protein
MVVEELVVVVVVVITAPDILLVAGRGGLGSRAWWIPMMGLRS